MPLQKVLFKPGVNKENTRYTNEGGWFECDKVRFRQGTPEVIGGWNQISGYTFIGVCRSLWNWITLIGYNLMGVGTNVKFYIENGGLYKDITPIRSTVTLAANPFVATTSSTTITVTAAAHGAISGDYVTFSGAVGLGGNITATVLNAEYSITVLTANTYTFTATATANATDTAGSPGGGASVVAAYQISVGTAVQVPLVGWGGGAWGAGTWGLGSPTGLGLRLWNQINFGENLIFGPNGGAIYYWIADVPTYARGILLSQPGSTKGAVSITVGTPAVVTLAGFALTEGAAIQFTGTLPTGMSTNTTYYVYNLIGSAFNLLSIAVTLGANPFTATNGSATVTVTATAHGHATGDYVTFSGAVNLGGNMTATVLNATYQITVTGANTYTFTATATGNATDAAGSPGGGSVVVATYQTGVVLNTTGTASSGAYISLLVDVPTSQNALTVSDSSRFVLAFGVNDYSSTAQDPMLIRWSNQEDPYNWTPDATNQAGSIRLSHGSKIVSVIQTRQEIVVITDASVYSLQYLGAPIVWGSQLLGDNISIVGPNATAVASSIVYWMGVDKFYMYDGRVQTLNCDLRRFVFNNINTEQYQQIFGSTSEGFNEVWWFYCSEGSATVDRYVVYNYAEKIWYYGTMARTAWIDSGLRNYPQAATYTYNLVSQEYGFNNNETSTTTALDAYISSSEFDIQDGNNFGFVWRVLPDLTFGDSTNSTSGTSPQVTITLYGMTNSGSGATQDASATVSKVAAYNITEEFTGQIYTRLRGRQMIFKVGSNQINTSWQLGAPRIDIRPDGRR